MTKRAQFNDNVIIIIIVVVLVMIIIIVIVITLVRGRTIGKDRKLVTKRAPPQTAKGKRKPLEQKGYDDEK